jgi:hypothetical protein
MSNSSNISQTVSFEIELEYFRHEVIGTDRPTTAVHSFEYFEDMVSFFATQRRRRAHADKPTGARYRMILTDYGRERCAEDREVRERHFGHVSTFTHRTIHNMVPVGEWMNFHKSGQPFTTIADYAA